MASLYRHSDTPAEATFVEAPRFVYARWNWVCASLFGGGGFVLVCFLAGIFHSDTQVAPLLPTLTIVSSLLIAGAVTARERVVVDPRGMDYALLCWWWIPVSTTYFALDAEAQPYDAWDDDFAILPSGVCLQHARELVSDGPAKEDVVCFESDEKRATELAQAITAAIERARTFVGPTPTVLRCKPLAPHESTLDIATAERSVFGRFVRISTRAPLRIGRLTLPVKTTLHLNGAHYIDPRLPDVLVSAVLTTSGPLLSQLIGVAGTTLSFRDDGSVTQVKYANEGRLHSRGLCWDAACDLTFSREGTVIAGTLAEAPRGALVTLPTRSRLIWGESNLGPLLGAKDFPASRWEVTLAARVQLIELTLRPGDILYVDANAHHVLGIRSKRVFEIDGMRLCPDWQVLPLQRDGSIVRGRALARFIKQAEIIDQVRSPRR